MHYKTVCHNILSVNYHIYIYILLDECHFIGTKASLHQLSITNNTSLLMRRFISTSNIYLIFIENKCLSDLVFDHELKGGLECRSIASKAHIALLLLAVLNVKIADLSMLMTLN